MATRPPAVPRFELQPPPELDDASSATPITSVVIAVILSVPIWILVGVLLAALWP